MFLKSIVLHGFKSFADRTEFSFGQGLTGIVGPNGCGKSNVLDAIRWVLGEQSARSLRGGRMSDVIFAGSRSRKPATFAEVTLTFDNRAGILRTDDEEVAVGRVLYANGDSEYRINGNLCRLKDIRDLLLDTGVGVDAYSVIEQGRVDLLLQASPLERREIFEEAAGISRYKVRRAEAQRKLERTQTNLLRLQDIVEELERRLRSVKLAAGKARNYIEYDARLRELRSSYGMAEFHELEQSRRAVAQEVQQLNDAGQALRADLAARDAEAAERGQMLQALDEQIQAAETRLLELQTSLSALAERIEQCERRRANLLVLRERRQKQGEGVDERVAELQARLAAEEAGLDHLRTVEAASEQRMSDVQSARQDAEQRTQGSRQQLERERVAAFDAVRRASLLQNEQTNVEQQEQRLTAQADRLRARRAVLAQEEQELEQRLAELATRLATLEHEATELRSALRGEEEQLVRLAEQARELAAQISALKQARSGAMSRLTLLEDMERRLEGVERGTQEVLAWRDDPALQNVIAGLAADVLRIDDPRVALLQPVLSTFETHVLVRDITTFLNELRQRPELSGPVRVLALERLAALASDGQPTPVATTGLGYRGTPGFVARAVDWVECAPEFRPLAEHLLGRVIVVDTVERALRLAQDALTGYVFVTLDGWTVGADGRATCGPASMTSGLISRKAEARQLQSELDEIEVNLEHAQRAQAETAQQTSDAELRRQGLLERIAVAQRTEVEVRSQRMRAEGERQRFAREAGTIDDELGGVQRTLAELTARRERLVGESEAVHAVQHTHETEVERLGRELHELEAALARLAQEYTAALVEKERAAEKRVASEEVLKDLRNRMATLERERVEALREAAEAEREITAAESELTDARQQRGEVGLDCERQQADGLALREQRQQLRQSMEQGGTEVRTIQRRIEELDANLHQRQVKLREIEVRKEDLVARVRDELDLNLEERYASYEHHEQDWEAVKTEIDELRTKITRLGHVNLDAITELDELTPRHEQMVTQRDDLTLAIERLDMLIATLDQESRTRFTAAFEQIRVNFQDMFRKLFGGGKADIILEDPENPLECGIDIIARPPGKEPQSLSLLSGGEKTMTAVALLMGVFKSRPSPFTILDEVDAALDESNVDRFNTVLHEFLSQTQFVVITHSKRTMACVDVLYGITMEEPGVSKRVSVRFDDRVRTPSVA